MLRVGVSHHDERKGESKSLASPRSRVMGIVRSKGFLAWLLAACGFLLLVVWVVGRVVLYLQTGSFFYHNYEWYHEAEVSRRLLGSSYQAFNYSSRCAHDPAPMPFVTEDTYEDVFTDFFRSGADSATSSGKSSHHHSVLKPSSSQDPIVVHIAVSPTSPDLFGYLWHSILHDDSPYVSAVNNLYEPATREFPRHGIKFVVVPPSTIEEQRLQLKDSKNVIIVGNVFEQYFVDALALPGHTRFGLVTLGREDCCNSCSLYEPRFSDIFRFAFMTYGDCWFIDNRRMFLWPLGPMVMHQFPPVLSDSLNPLSSDRKYLLNLMITISKTKASRMQSWMAATDECASRSADCYVAWNSALFNFASMIDDMLGTNLKSLSNAPEEYLRILRQSKLTLCPFGKNAEQYRIWEAIMAGSIPVLIDPVGQHQANVAHPNYPDSFSCRPKDLLRILKDTNAPVFWIRDWRNDLPTLLDSLNDKILDERQRALQKWYARFTENLRLSLFYQIRSNFAPAHSHTERQARTQS